MHQTNEQRNYQLKVKELRSKWKKPSGDGNDSDSGGEPPGMEKDRQPRLTDLTPDYDLKLFMEAQALASEKIVCPPRAAIYPILSNNFKSRR